MQEMAAAGIFLATRQDIALRPTVGCTESVHTPGMHEDSVFREWRAASGEARAQERALTKASLRALDGEGETPSDNEREKARTLRHHADALFQCAMQEFKLRVGRRRGR